MVKLPASRKSIDAGISRYESVPVVLKPIEPPELVGVDNGV